MFRLNVRTRLSKFKPREPLPDPRAVEVMYNASELIQPPSDIKQRFLAYNARKHQEEVS